MRRNNENNNKSELFYQGLCITCYILFIIGVIACGIVAIFFGVTWIHNPDESFQLSGTVLIIIGCVIILTVIVTLAIIIYANMCMARVRLG